LNLVLLIFIAIDSRRTHMWGVVPFYWDFVYEWLISPIAGIDMRQRHIRYTLNYRLDINRRKTNWESL